MIMYLARLLVSFVTHSAVVGALFVSMASHTIKDENTTNSLSLAYNVSFSLFADRS